MTPCSKPLREVIGDHVLFTPYNKENKIMRNPMIGTLVFLALGLMAAGPVSAADVPVSVGVTQASLGSVAPTFSPRLTHAQKGDSHSNYLRQFRKPHRILIATHIRPGLIYPCTRKCENKYKSCLTKWGKKRVKRGDWIDVRTREECWRVNLSCKTICRQ